MKKFLLFVWTVISAIALHAQEERGTSYEVRGDVFCKINVDTLMTGAQGVSPKVLKQVYETMHAYDTTRVFKAKNVFWGLFLGNEYLRITTYSQKVPEKGEKANQLLVETTDRLDKAFVPNRISLITIVLASFFIFWFCRSLKGKYKKGKQVDDGQLAFTVLSCMIVTFFGALHLSISVLGSPPLSFDKIEVYSLLVNPVMFLIILPICIGRIKKKYAKIINGPH